MRPSRNLAAIAAVQRAAMLNQLDGHKVPMKPLYIAQNAYDIPLDEPIYRICSLDHLLEDIAGSRLTHTRISAENWGDSNENPLIDRKFPDSQTDGGFTLNGLFKDMFGSCWSRTALDGEDSWSNFSHGKKSVRIRSTPQKLLAAVMNEDNPYYQLHHSIGKVQYWSKAELNAYFQDPDYEKHLDSLGQGISLALTRLHAAGEHEDEVRLLCSYMSAEPWVAANMRLSGEFLQVPFDWKGVIDGVLVGPRVQAGGLRDIAKRLESMGINCPVTSSATRPYTG